MAQMVIYVDDEFKSKVEKTAKDKNTSVSKWVKSICQKELHEGWPHNYGDLFGSLSNVDIEIPEDYAATDDLEPIA
jgi:hypothetical protein